jgi:hypothetical protein
VKQVINKTSGYIVQQGQRMDLTGAISRNEKTVLFEETTLAKKQDGISINGKELM